jgi:hypothetical protein
MCCGPNVFEGICVKGTDTITRTFYSQADDSVNYYQSLGFTCGAYPPFHLGGLIPTYEAMYCKRSDIKQQEQAGNPCRDPYGDSCH